jgi:RNA polymerase sigma factor (sigma-70 family)
MNINDHSPLIYLIDDDKAVSQGLSLLIRTVGLRVETFAEPEAFLSAYDPNSIGCIVLDIRMPGMSGLEVLENLANAQVTHPVVMITGHGSVDLCRRAFKSGAMEFLQKPIDDQLFLDTLQKAVKQHIATRERQRASRETQQKFERLSEREHEVFAMMAEGLTTKQIAKELGLSPRTVETHRAHLFAKLEVESLVQLIRSYCSLLPESEKH